MCQPPFDALTRVARKIKDREAGHVAKTASAVADMLLDPYVAAAVFDSGRGSALVASGQIATGQGVLNYDDPKLPLPSHLVLPYEPDHLVEVLAGIVALATNLRVVAGYVAVEPTYERAQRAALPMQPKRRDVTDFPRRAQERLAHMTRSGRGAAELATAEWATFLGRQHRARLGVPPAVSFARSSTSATPGSWACSPTIRATC